MNKSNTVWIVSVSFLLAALGFLLPLWPLCVVGILLAALSGRWLSAVGVGLLIDVAWGAPVGFFHIFIFPFTLVALIAILGRHFSMSYIRRSGSNMI